MVSGIAHVSFTVSDLERSLRFYRDLLGFEVKIEVERSGPDVEGITGIRGTKLKIGFLSLDGFILELIQYVSPVGEKLDLRTNNVGCAHVAFYVSDIEKTYDFLSAEGVRFRSKPNQAKAGPYAGGRVVYLLDPDGITLELIQRAEDGLKTLNL
jgi:catechol 2,3-dioxygenase-like lactoylglutathione lyase family enzyme